MSASKHLDEIEQTLADIERIDAETRGQFRQAADREAFDICARIERKMLQKLGNEVPNAGSG